VPARDAAAGLCDRYGWRPLPAEIPANEFEQIEREAGSNRRPWVINHNFGKKLSFCRFESCSHHEFIRVLRFFPICYQYITAVCCKLCPPIGHKFKRELLAVEALTI
jgi:hypothetical protein